MKIAIYARVSTRDKGQNPEMQLEPLRKYCRAMEWEIYNEFIDQASSADLEGRKNWGLLLQSAARHEFDTLLIWKLDRAFRSMVHAANTLDQLNSWKVGFRSLMDPSIDTTTPNGMLVFNILASVAQFEKDLIVLRINEGIAYAKAHGTKTGTPIGRKRYDIPFANLCKALIQAKGNLTDSAKLLTYWHNKKVSPGFVLSRIKRAGLTKEEIMESGTIPLQTLPQKTSKK